MEDSESELFLSSPIEGATVAMLAVFYFDSLPPIEGGERTLAGRLEREMRRLTSMVWDDTYAR